MNALGYATACGELTDGSALILAEISAQWNF